jgi:hypothetical protein
MKINLNNKTFKALSNSDNGQVSNATLFHYFQEGNTIWANYQGGEIVKGAIIGTINGNELDFIYHHLSKDKILMTGKCKTLISVNPNGKYVLDEKWQWTSGDMSEGTSVLIEE